LLACEETGIPWIIVSVFADGVKDIRRVEPSGYVAPLIGRTFYYGILDCFTIIQDYYLREHGIHIERVDSVDGWWKGDQEIYIDNFRDAGFVKVEDDTLKPGDVIFMQIRSKRTNHAAVYLGESSLKEAPNLFNVPDAMLHHFHGQLSERAVYGGYYKTNTRMIVRHKRFL
jgi:cell wall-associated NlpC family hydrolase